MADAAKFGISRAAFGELLLRIAQKCLPGHPSANQVEAFCRKLHLRDLALAHACARGEETAWQEFLRRYGHKLQWMALQIVGDGQLAREMADTLLADLFCAAKDAGEQPSKLASYSGRGPLESWLKALLFRGLIDRYRVERRYVGLESALIPINSNLFSDVSATGHESTQLEESMRDALQELSGEERFLLAAYFLDERSLVQIAGALRVHESTASRRLSKTLNRLRKIITRKLRAQGLDQRAITDLLRNGAPQLSFDLRSDLLFRGEMAEDPL